MQSARTSGWTRTRPIWPAPVENILHLRFATTASGTSVAAFLTGKQRSSDSKLGNCSNNGSADDIVGRTNLCRWVFRHGLLFGCSTEGSRWRQQHRWAFGELLWTLDGKLVKLVIVTSISHQDTTAQLGAGLVQYELTVYSADWFFPDEFRNVGIVGHGLVLAERRNITAKQLKFR
jgi:hypothetical protein